MENTWKIGDIAICVKVGPLVGQIGNSPALVLQKEKVIINLR